MLRPNEPVAGDSAAAALDQFLQHLSDSLHAEFGVAFRDLETNRDYLFNATSMMHAASTMKVPVMIEVFRQAEAGKFGLQDSILIKNEFSSIVDGSSYSLALDDDSEGVLNQEVGKKATIRRLVEAMITVSSNLATNLLIELVGAKSVMQTLSSLGIRNIQVLRGVEDTKAYRAGLNNRTDAYDLMLTMAAIASQRAVTPRACDDMIEILKAQKFREKIPAGLPAHVTVGNKTGSITAIDHDCAILFPPNRRPAVVVILTRGIADHQQACQVIAGISRRLYEAFVEKPPAVPSH